MLFKATADFGPVWSFSTWAGGWCRRHQLGDGFRLRTSGGTAHQNWRVFVWKWLNQQNLDLVFGGSRVDPKADRRVQST
jgi:hypothetical protein